MKYIAPLTEEQAIALNNRIGEALGFTEANEHTKRFAELEFHPTREGECAIPLKARFEDAVMPLLTLEEIMLVKEFEELRDDGWFNPLPGGREVPAWYSRMWSYLWG